ncbi:unnamed protein product [Gemmata massiliana]|uniref:Uncharacterized protein n=1 Tax=Gemmata massiliana TaxID=1210884 RepID=A0A6P2D400_9BACT|nr:hypothetical protein [Gemmata massiliana]VTR94120.1 unnamed protein product [Gemmata massiliana]
MFRGEETIRIRTGMRGSEVEVLIEHALARLGRVRFYKGGVFEVTGPRLGSAMSVTEVTGRLSRGRRDDEWIVDVEYAVRPSTLCWVLLVLGVVFLFLLGLLLLLIPYTTKGEVQRVVTNALRDVRDDAEDE